MARAKRTVDEVEVDEIINLKLEELGGRKNKLTANGLAKFSKKIANNEEYIRSDGSLFNYYGYDFWASDYKGEDYYGKKRLAEIKNSVEVRVAGRDFLPEVQDIILLKSDLEEFKRGFATLFLNSNSADHSLNDVLSVPRLRDGNVSAELQNMFKEEYKDLVDTYTNITASNENKMDNVSDIAKLKARRERRRGL